MTQFVHIDYQLQHPGVVRVERAVEALGAIHIPSAVLALLASLGRPIVRAVEALGAHLAVRQQLRRDARADAQIWHLARTDARLVADLSRTMSAAALRDVRE